MPILKTKNQKSSSLIRKNKSKTNNSSNLISKIMSATNVPNRQISNAYPKLTKGHLSLTKCALKFALACAEPFHPKARGVCGVMGYSLGPTVKISNVQRFTFQAGTAGYGFCAITPTIAYDTPSAFITSNTYIGTTTINILTANNALATGVTPVYGNQTYTAATFVASGSSFNNQITDARIISVGFRVTYVGTTMNESGSFTCLAPSEHYNVTMSSGGSNSTLAQLQGDPQVIIEPCDRGWCDMTIVPGAPFEVGWSSNNAISSTVSTLYPYCNGSSAINGYTFAGTSGYSTGAPIAIVVVSGAVAGNTYQVEMITHTELSGQNMNSLASPSESDEEGGRIVLRAASQMSISKASTGKKGWALMYGLLQEAGTAAIENLVPLGISAVAAML